MEIRVKQFKYELVLGRNDPVQNNSGEQNLPIDEITSLDSTQHKGRSDTESKFLKKNLSPTHHDQITQNNLQGSLQLPTLSRPDFSIQSENKLSDTINVCDVSQRITLRNSEDLPVFSATSGQNSVRVIQEVASVCKILKPVENIVTSYQVSESGLLTKKHTNSPVRTNCSGHLKNNTHNVVHSSSVTPLDTGLKRTWISSEGSPDVGDTAYKRTRRKFPGPAGLLPKLRPGSKIEEVPNVITSDEVKIPEETMILSSQSGDDVFCDSPWQRLLQDLGSDAYDILKKFSVASSLQKAVKKQLPNGKVPLMFAVLESIDCQGTDAGVILKDRSGKIQGTFHRELVKEHASCLQTGVAFVLRQVGIISPNSRNHYLNITPNNIVSIYAHQERDCVNSFSQNSSQTLRELVQLIDSQSQLVVPSSCHLHQAVSRNVSVLSTGSSKELKSPGVVNQHDKARLYQECSRTPLRTSSEVNTVMTPLRTTNCNMSLQINTSVSPNSADTIKVQLARSCQLNSSNSVSTPVRKWSFKPTANTPLQNHSQMKDISRLEPKKLSNTPQNLNVCQNSKDLCNNNFAGSVSDLQKCSIVSCSSSVLKSGNPLGNAAKQQSSVIGQTQHTQAGPVNTSTPKYSFKPKIPATVLASTALEQSSITKRTLPNDQTCTTNVQNRTTTICDENTELHFKKIRISQTNQQHAVKTASAESSVLHDPPGLKRTSADSGAFDWDDDLWQNGELELSDELLSQLSEDM